VWGRDRIAYGPVDLQGLARLIHEGHLTADSWVFFEPDDRWGKARDFPELQEFFRSTTTHGPGPSPEGRGLHGASLKPESLRRIKVFAGLDDRQIESFVRFMEVVSYPQFSNIVRKGEHGAAMYLVLEGEVRALIIVDGKESILSTITAGEAFGEISVLDQGPRSADIIANKDSVLLRVSAAAFERLLREAPALAVPVLLGLSRAVVGRVRSLTKRYEDSVHLIRATTGPH
jgi:hypothetical protein